MHRPHPCQSVESVKAEVTYGGSVPQIFDNLKAESSIGPALQNALTNFDSCDIATGYLDLRGWAQLR